MLAVNAKRCYVEGEVQSSITMRRSGGGKRRNFDWIIRQDTCKKDRVKIPVGYLCPKVKKANADSFNANQIHSIIFLTEESTPINL